MNLSNIERLIGLYTVRIGKVAYDNFDKSLEVMTAKESARGVAEAAFIEGFIAAGLCAETISPDQGDSVEDAMQDGISALREEGDVMTQEQWVEESGKLFSAILKDNLKDDHEQGLPVYDGLKIIAGGAGMTDDEFDKLLGLSTSNGEIKHVVDDLENPDVSDEADDKPVDI